MEISHRTRVPVGSIFYLLLGPTDLPICVVDDIFFIALPRCETGGFRGGGIVPVEATKNNSKTGQSPHSYILQEYKKKIV